MRRVIYDGSHNELFKVLLIIGNAKNSYQKILAHGLASPDTFDDCSWWSHSFDAIGIVNHGVAPNNWSDSSLGRRAMG